MTDDIHKPSLFTDPKKALWTDDGRLISTDGEEIFTVKFFPTVGEATVLRPRLSRISK